MFGVCRPFTILVQVDESPSVPLERLSKCLWSLADGINVVSKNGFVQAVGLGTQQRGFEPGPWASSRVTTVSLIVAYNLNFEIGKVCRKRIRN